MDLKRKIAMDSDSSAQSSSDESYSDETVLSIMKKLRRRIDSLDSDGGTIVFNYMESDEEDESSDDDFEILFSDDTVQNEVDDVPNTENEEDDDMEVEDETDKDMENCDRVTESTDEQVPSTPTGAVKEKKKVKFADEHSLELVKVHNLVHWNFAYRSARKGRWMQEACDRMRFQHRIDRISTIVSPVLEKEHRKRVFKNNCLF